jgi:iron complex outermembrane receptor protein
MFFDLRSMASGGLHNESIYTTGRYPGYSITNLAPFLQSSYDLNDIFTLSGGVRYQWTENRVDDLSAYAQQQDIASGKRARPMPSRAVKPIMITSCLTPGLSPSPTVSRPGLTSRRALSCRTG